MMINVKASTMVKPAAAAPNATLWLSNWDVMLPEHAHTLTLYFYRPTAAAAADAFFDTAVLTAALGRALVEFYPVAGRLRKDGEGRIEINCNGEGALFVEAEADADMDDLGEFGPRPDLGLIPKVDYSLGISSFPILLLQVTRFRCGGVCLGISTEHHVFDGISAYHFINTWADIARGFDISVPPFLNHRVLAARNPPEIKYDHIEFQPPPPLKNPQHKSQTVFSTFKLTRHHLSALKATCLEDQGNRATYTTFEALTGHLWRCICKARELPEDQETKLYVIVDGRTRLRPPLPPGYFGNAVTKAARIATSGDLQSNPLASAARKVREALAQMNDEYLRSAIDYLELNGGLAPNARGTVLYKSPNLGITSWARLPFYEADFGWGRPVYIAVGAAPAEGHIIVLPSPKEDGSLLIALSLPKGQVDLFQKFLYDI